MKKRTPENLTLDAICQYLEYKRYFFFRVNNIPIFDPIRKVPRSMPKYSRKGVSDIICVHKGKTYFIEVKSNIGKQSDDQKEFERGIVENGEIYLLAREVNDIIKVGL